MKLFLLIFCIFFYFRKISAFHQPLRGLQAILRNHKCHLHTVTNDIWEIDDDSAGLMCESSAELQRKIEAEKARLEAERLRKEAEERERLRLEQERLAKEKEAEERKKAKRLVQSQSPTNTYEYATTSKPEIAESNVDAVQSLPVGPLASLAIGAVLVYFIFPLVGPDLPNLFKSHL